MDLSVGSVKNAKEPAGSFFFVAMKLYVTARPRAIRDINGQKPNSTER